LRGEGLQPEDFIDRKEARKMDPFAQFAVVASDEAIRDSGLKLETDEKRNAPA
jgi:3-oxoacyl-[acyl-carrier-protein] synthase II